MSDWLEHTGLLVPLALGWLAIWLLMPKEGQKTRILGGLVAIGALLSLKYTMLPPAGDAVRNGLFYVFAFTAVGSAALMITDRSPVYAALWFAVVTLSVCGLFLLNSAPFLAATTIIVYAGAIVVTFLFVIMLAQQTDSGANYDQRPYQPGFASFFSFLLLGALLFTLQEWGGIDRKNPSVDPLPGQFSTVPAAVSVNVLSRPPKDNPNEIGSLRVLGRSLFSDYLYAVELAGTVLLIATIGAIAIAPRRSQGTL